jgi:hypothetical protein
VATSRLCLGSRTTSAGGIVALLVSIIVWHAVLGGFGEVVEAACNAGTYTASFGTCIQCDPGYFCANGSFNALGAIDGQGMVL